MQPRWSGAKVVRCRAGDDTCDVCAVVAGGQPPGESVEVAECGLERGPRQADVTFLAAFAATSRPVSI